MKYAGVENDKYQVWVTPPLQHYFTLCPHHHHVINNDDDSQLILPCKTLLCSPHDDEEGKEDDGNWMMKTFDAGADSDDGIDFLHNTKFLKKVLNWVGYIDQVLRCVWAAFSSTCIV